MKQYLELLLIMFSLNNLKLDMKIIISFPVTVNMSAKTRSSKKNTQASISSFHYFTYNSLRSPSTGV